MPPRSKFTRRPPRPISGRQSPVFAELASASTTTAMVRNTLDGLTLIESIPSWVR